MKKFLTLGPQEIQTGIYKGVNKAAVLLWQEGVNVGFRELGLKRVSGAELQIAYTGGLTRDIAQAYVAGARRIYVGTDAEVKRLEFNLGAWSENAVYTWPTAGSYADLETFGTWLLMTNNIDPVAIWKNTGSGAALAGTTFTRARIIKRKGPYMLAMNTNNGDTRVEWSHDSNVELWTPASTNRAGNFTIRDLESEILACEDLGERLAIYSRSALSIGTLLGGTNVWGFKTQVTGVGAVSRRSVVTVDPYNYGLTELGIFKTDGVSYAYVDDPAMVRWLKDTADFSKANLFWGFHDDELRCVTWYFQDAFSVWHSISYHYVTNLFTTGNLSLTAGARKEVFGWPIVVGSTGKNVGAWQESSQHFGADIPFSIITKPLDFGTREFLKVLQMVRVDGVYDPTNFIKIKALAHPEDTAGVTIMDKALVRENYLPQGGFEAAYFTMEFYGTKPLSATGIEFYGVVGGLNL